jgi:hypothetical protein
LDYGIQKEKIYHLLPTQMQIGQVVLMTNEAPGDSTIKDSTGEDPTDRKMKGMTRYHLMSFLRELLLFFISSFLFFPSHIKRTIFCFFYSVDHQPSFIYPSLEEEAIVYACVVDVDPISSA